jgi:hypothetical protein
VSFVDDKRRAANLKAVPSIPPVSDPVANDAVTLLLEKALSVLDERGWTKIRFKNRQGNVCLLGALRVADGRPARWPARRSPAYRDAVTRLDRSAHRRGFDRTTSFNDSPRTELPDVVGFVRQTIRETAAGPGAPRL